MWHLLVGESGNTIVSTSVWDKHVVLISRCLDFPVSTWQIISLLEHGLGSHRKKSRRKATDPRRSHGLPRRPWLLPWPRSCGDLPLHRLPRVGKHKRDLWLQACNITDADGRGHGRLDIRWCTLPPRRVRPPSPPLKT